VGFRRGDDGPPDERLEHCGGHGERLGSSAPPREDLAEHCQSHTSSQAHPRLAFANQLLERLVDASREAEDKLHARGTRPSATAGAAGGGGQLAPPMGWRGECCVFNFFDRTLLRLAGLGWGTTGCKGQSCRCVCQTKNSLCFAGRGWNAKAAASCHSQSLTSPLLACGV
jgi:hypothetical protein